jgi:hypothetical protein
MQDIGFVWSPTGDFQAAYDPGTSSREEAFGAWRAEVAYARHNGHADFLREGIDGTVGA